jgi:2-polyprenyl-3-methyl-5-hydroxy-6-metoxy-1,4-benzoquinol methylase
VPDRSAILAARRYVVDDYEMRLAAELRAAHEDFFDYTSRRLRDEYAAHIPCPVCDATRSRPFLTKDLFSFVRCDCGMVYTNPRLNDQANNAFYNGRYNEVYNERKFYEPNERTLAITRREVRQLLQLIHKYRPERGDFMEVGCGGEGTFLDEALAAGYSVTGVELNEECCRRIASRFGNRVTVVDKPLEQSGIPDRSYDVVAMRDVLEHIPNPKPFLTEVARVMRPGGILTVQVPNIDGLVYRSVGSRHACIFGFEHLNYWSSRPMQQVLEKTGFRLLQIKHESTDFTLRQLTGYWFGQPAFTSVFKPKRGVMLDLASLGSRAVLRPLRWFDERLTPFVADFLGMGSVIKVIAERV